MTAPDDDSPDRRRFLRDAGVVGVAGLGGGIAGYLASGGGGSKTVHEVGGSSGTDKPAKVFVLPGSTTAAAVNDAIDAAAEPHGGGGGLPGGGLVVIGGGDVNLDRPVVLRPVVVLAGTGWGTKLIRSFDGGPMVTFQAGGGAEPGAYGAEVRDLFLVGGQAAYRSNDNVGILLDATNPKGHGWTDPNCRIHGVRVSYCAGHGIVVASHPGSGGTTSRACLLSACFVSGNGGDGFNLDGSDAIVDSCYSFSNTGAGLSIEAGNVTVTASKASYNDGSGFVVASQRAVLTGCQAQDNQPDGFVLRGTSGTTVTGCQGDTNRDANLRIANTTASAVTGFVSVHRDAGRFPAPTDAGVVIGAGTSGCLISGVAPSDAGGSKGEHGDNTVQLVG
jgi:hypothetical protein